MALRSFTTVNRTKYEGAWGEVLQKRRLEMGMSQEDVFEKIRIPLRYIQAMEESNLRALPPACYTVGFIKTYCRLLGLEPEKFVQAYQVRLTPSHHVVLRFLVETVQRLTPRRLPDILQWVAVCVFVALCWFAYMVVVQPQTDALKKQVDASTIQQKLVVPVPPDLHESR